MKLATLLPASSAEYIQTTVGCKPVVHARTWPELELLLNTKPITVVFLDPAADGLCNTSTALKCLREYPSTSFIAYVSLNAVNFGPIAKLSKYGLAGAILHPANDQTFWNALERVTANSLVRDFVGAFEASLAHLPRPIVAAIHDLFERPERYQFPSDIALEAGTTPAKICRIMKSAKLGSPQKLMIAAKLLRGYSYLRNSRLTVDRVCGKLGYSDRRMFEAHAQTVLGTTPSGLREVADSSEIVRVLLEWFYKPSRRHRLARAPDSAGLP